VNAINSHLEQLASEVLESAFQVHRSLGPGLLEGTYRLCLIHELGLRGIHIETELPISILYKGKCLPNGYRADFVIEKQLLLELKAVESLTRLHMAQTITYLKLTGLRLGFIINFNSPMLKEGIRRVVHPSVREFLGKANVPIQGRE
jgi:GxxExxY protein